MKGAKDKPVPVFVCRRKQSLLYGRCVVITEDYSTDAAGWVVIQATGSGRDRVSSMCRRSDLREVKRHDAQHPTRD